MERGSWRRRMAATTGVVVLLIACCAAQPTASPTASPTATVSASVSPTRAAPTPAAGGLESNKTPTAADIAAQTTPSVSAKAKAAASACSTNDDCKTGQKGCACIEKLCQGLQCKCDALTGPLCHTDLACDKDTSLCVDAKVKTAGGSRSWSIGVSVLIAAVVIAVVVGTVIMRRRRQRQAAPLATGDMGGAENWS